MSSQVLVGSYRTVKTGRWGVRGRFWRILFFSFCASVQTAWQQNVSFHSRESQVVNCAISALTVNKIYNFEQKMLITKHIWSVWSIRRKWCDIWMLAAYNVIWFPSDEMSNRAKVNARTKAHRATRKQMSGAILFHEEQFHATLNKFPRKPPPSTVYPKLSKAMLLSTRCTVLNNTAFKEKKAACAKTRWRTFSSKEPYRKDSRCFITLNLTFGCFYLTYLTVWICFDSSITVCVCTV